MEKQEQTSLENENIEKFKDLILTAEQYKETSFAEEGGVYVFEISEGVKKIVYFGSRHTNDPEDELFEELKKKFEETKPDIVYVEGRESINNKKDAVRQLIKEDSLDETKCEGESHFALKLAVDAGIDFESPEPDFSEEIKEMVTKGFLKQDIFKYCTYRIVDQYQRQNELISNEDCKKYLEPYIKQIYKQSGWDVVELNSLKEELFSDLDVTNKEKYSSETDPIP